MVTPTAILKLPVVQARTGLSRSSIYQRMSEDSFPTSVSLGGRAIGWVEAEIEDWLNRQVEHSRKTTRQAGGARA